MKSETIKLTKRDIEKATEFTTLRTKDSALYQKRGGFKSADVLTGALGELAVYKLLKSRSIKTNKPDLTIHTSKSYDSDLTDGTNSYHIKSQSTESVRRYGESWLMQRSDPLFKDVPFKQYMIPTVVDLEGGTVEIYGVMNFKTIIEKELVGECALEWFRKSKVAIYLKDLETLTWNQRWRKINANT